MGSQARNYTPLTLKKLFALSGNQCSFPGCKKVMVNHENAKESNICHIEAANDNGERYRALMSDKERADYDNLILLCVQHHDETNDVDIYTVAELKKMKAAHEGNFMEQGLERSPSMLRVAVNKISELGLKQLKSDQDTKVFNIGKKIKHNKLKSNNFTIQRLRPYFHKLNCLYEELESRGSLKKENLLDNIHQIYLDEAGKLIGDSDDYLTIIQDNSDKIYEAVFDRLMELVQDQQTYAEDLSPAIKVVMVDAFMRCKILEEPE